MTKEFTFMEASSHDEGTRFTLKEHEINDYLYFNEGTCYNSHHNPQNASRELVRATFIVIDQDKEWNLLAQRKVYQQDLEYWSEHSIKKCQDLIIQDLDELKLGNCDSKYINTIVTDLIKRRFGDL